MDLTSLYSHLEPIRIKRHVFQGAGGDQVKVRIKDQIKFRHKRHFRDYDKVSSQIIHCLGDTPNAADVDQCPFEFNSQRNEITITRRKTDGTLKRAVVRSTHGTLQLIPANPNANVSENQPCGNAVRISKLHESLQGKVTEPLNPGCYIIRTGLPAFDFFDSAEVPLERYNELTVEAFRR